MYSKILTLLKYEFPPLTFSPMCLDSQHRVKGLGYCCHSRQAYRIIWWPRALKLPANLGLIVTKSFSVIKVWTLASRERGTTAGQNSTLDSLQSPKKMEDRLQRGLLARNTVRKGALMGTEFCGHLHFFVHLFIFQRYSKC